MVDSSVPVLCYLISDSETKQINLIISTFVDRIALGADKCVIRYVRNEIFYSP